MFYCPSPWMQTPGYRPPFPVHAGKLTPFLVHAGKPTPLSSVCWEPTPFPVHVGKPPHHVAFFLELSYHPNMNNITPPSLPSLQRLFFSHVCQSFCSQGEVGFPACTGKGFGFPVYTGNGGCVFGGSASRGRGLRPGGGRGSASRWGEGICIQVGGRGSAFRGRVVCIQGEGPASSGVCFQGVGQTPPPQRYVGYYGIRSKSRWYTSYWNAFLLVNVNGM